MKGKFDFGLCIVSLLCAGAGCALCFHALGQMETSAMGRILWSGLFFSVPLLFVLLGCFLLETIRKKKMRFLRAWNRMVSVGLAVLFGFLCGAGGQAVYMLSHKSVSGDVDLVLMLDGSNSMEGYQETCVTAAGQLIEQMDERCRIQAISFSALVLGSTPLLSMDQEGKEYIKTFLDEADVMGGTNFNEPLRMAESVLEENQEEGRIQAAVMLTDGEGELDEAVKESFLNQGIRLSVIRIVTGEAAGEATDALLQFAEDTGGFHTEVESVDGTIDGEKMIQAFRETFQATSGLYMGEGFLAIGEAEKPVLWHLAVRAVFLALYGVLVGIVYYQRQNVGQILSNAAVGLLTAVLISVLGMTGTDDGFVSAAVFCLLLFGMYTTQYPAKEGEGHV